MLDGHLPLDVGQLIGHVVQINPGENVAASDKIKRFVFRTECPCIRDTGAADKEIQQATRESVAERELMCEILTMSCFGTSVTLMSRDIADSHDAGLGTRLPCVPGFR